MRKVKYRVWLKGEKRYVFPAAIFLDFGIVTEIEYNDTTISGEVVRVRRTFDEFVLEQSTGLKDKNGKKIYEGDIVSVYEGRYIGSIIQHPSGEWRIIWVSPQGTEDSLYSHRTICKVVGNIHDVSELLEKQYEEN
jgi:hypothetical protein